MPEMYDSLDNVPTKRRVDALEEIVTGLDDKIKSIVLDTVSQKMSAGKVKQAMAEIKRLLNVTDAEARQWLVKYAPEQYVDGINVANKLVGITSAITLAEIINDKRYAAHKEAINAGIETAYTDIGTMLQSTEKGSQRLLNDTLGEQTGLSIAVGTAAAVVTSRAVVNDYIRDRGFAVMLRQGGRRFKLPQYATLIGRTNFVKLANEGIVNRSRQLGIEVVEWRTSLSERVCPICQPREGVRYSIIGGHEKYKQLPQIPAHPRCECYTEPVTPSELESE